MLALAGLFLLLGVIGLFLPVVPTVPFLLVAAWAAARCSPELNDWLHNHPQFGKPLCDWRDGGVVPRRAKWLATVMMSCTAVLMWLFVPQKWAVGIVIAIMATVALWLWLRPEQCAVQR
ncbi:MAG: DUF454 domain-containing protein [Comamonadaceae bacterium]|nr:MAG: DUF454 domain-containing protein [Comamonadaceae bacterium]